MISILIPVYNDDVTELVKDIYAQGIAQNIPFELILVDDGSDEQIKATNNSLKDLSHVIYEELDENIGRSKIRNYMASKANYDTLIFLDGDSQIKQNPNYISTYLHLSDSFVIVNGGRIYPGNKKSDITTTLHYLYGCKKECPSLVKRNQFPIRYFHSNNFMVKKSLVIEYPFPDMKTGYGYEDLVFATAMSNNGIDIKHTNNPVEHHGLIPSKEFLSKVKSANTNLIDFYHAGAITVTPLIKTYKRLKTLGLLKPTRFILNKLSNHLESNLNSASPNLFYLDLYKLHDFINKALGNE